MYTERDSISKHIRYKLPLSNQIQPMNVLRPSKKSKFAQFLWNTFCLSTIIGIWPRFIEPNILLTSKLKLPIPHIHPSLKGIKILQISDLHLNSSTSNHFLQKLLKKSQALKPDLIVFTGDFLCYAQLNDPQRLQTLLSKFHAPYGCFAILGNHDYNACVSINHQGDYDIIRPVASSLGRAFSRLIENITLTKNITDAARNIPLNINLLNLLKQTPFHLLHNETALIPIKDTFLNITGLGEYMLDRLDAENAFKNYNKGYPGITLLHNPDGIPSLKNYPGNIILCGHTHGGQVNLPWMWKKFTLLENMQFKKGLHQINDKWAYINRGIGGAMPFRWFSPPEILLLTLEDKQ